MSLKELAKNMPKTRKIKISSEFVKDWGLDDYDDDDEDKDKVEWSPKPKKARKSYKASPKKAPKAKKRRAISKISVPDLPSTEERPKKRRKKAGKPYSVTGSWYIATGYLQDLEHLLNLFENCEGSRFIDFASCWQRLSFSLVYRGRQNFKELLEFSEEMALLTKRFLWPNYSHKKNVGALYTLYGITYKHPVRTFFKVRLTKDEYRLLKDLVEPYRSKSDNPDPAYIFRKMEVEGAFFNAASEEEHCLEFYSYERELIDLEYQQHLMANKAKGDQLISEKYMEQDDDLLQYYHEVKCRTLGDGTKPEASLAMVDPDTVKGMQRIIQDTTDRNQQILDSGLCDTDKSPGKNKCIGLRRSAIRDKAIRVKPRCLYEQRDRNEKGKSSEEESLMNHEEDADGVEEPNALMEKWNQKSPGEGQIKSRKRKPSKSVVRISKNILDDEKAQALMTPPSQKPSSDLSSSSETPEDLKKNSRKRKPAKIVREINRSMLFDKEIQEFMTAPPAPVEFKPSNSDSPVGEIKKNIIEKALRGKGQRNSSVQTRRKAKDDAQAKLNKTPGKHSKKDSDELHTPEKDISQTPAICDPKIKKPVSTNRRTRSTTHTSGKSLVSPDKGTEKNWVSPDKGTGKNLVSPDKGAAKNSVSPDKGMGKNSVSPDKGMGKTPMPDQSTVHTEEEKEDKATEECVTSPKLRRKKGRPRKTEKAKPAVEEADDTILTDKSLNSSPEKSPGQYLERRKRKRERPRKYALFEASNEEEEVIQAVRPRRRRGFTLEEQIDSNGLSKEVEMTNIVRRLVHEKSPNVVNLDPDATTIILPQQQQQLQQSSMPLTLGSRPWLGSRLSPGEQNLTFSYARKNQSSSSSFADTGSTLVTLRLKVNINALVRKVMFQMTKKKWLEVKNDHKRMDAILEKLKPHLLLNLTGSKGDPSACIIEDIVEVPGASKGRQSSSDLLWAKKKGKPQKTPNITTSGGQHMLFSYKTNEEPTCQSSPSSCQFKVVKLADGKVVLVKRLGPDSSSDIESYEAGQDKRRKKKAPFMIIPLPPNYNVGGLDNRERTNKVVDAGDPLSFSGGLEARALSNGEEGNALSSDPKADAGSYLQRAMTKNSFGENVKAKKIINLEGEEISFSMVGNDSNYPNEVEEETAHVSENDDEPLSSPVQEINVWSTDDDDSVPDDECLSLGEDGDGEEGHSNERGSGETLSVVHRVSDLESNKDSGSNTLGSSANAVSNLQGSEVTPPRKETDMIQQVSQSTTIVTSMPLEASTPQKGEPYSIFVSTGIHVPLETRASVKEREYHEGMGSTGFQAEWDSSTEKTGTREMGQEAEFITSDPSTSSKGWEQKVIIPGSARDIPSEYPVQGSDAPQYAKILEAIPVEVDFSRNPLKFEDQVSITIEDNQFMSGHLPANDKEDQVDSLSREEASGRIADALELCQLSVNMAEATGTGPTGVDVSQYISALRVAQSKKQTTQETSSESAVHPVVLYTPVLLQNLVKTEVCDEPVRTDMDGAEGSLERKDLDEAPNQVTESDYALPETPKEHKVLSLSSSMEKPTHSSAQKSPEVSPEKLHESPLPQILPQDVPITESKAEIRATPKSTATLSTLQSPALQKHVNRTPVCSFLFSPKFKPLSKLSTCVGEATGKVQQRPRVKFFSKSYLFPRSRKSV